MEKHGSGYLAHDFVLEVDICCILKIQRLEGNIFGSGVLGGFTSEGFVRRGSIVSTMFVLKSREGCEA